MWQRKHIEELIDDLTSEFLEYYHPGDSRLAVADYGAYFMGSIVLAGRENAIIDGQQRFSSLTLLLMYLNNRLKSMVLSRVNTFVHKFDNATTVGLLLTLVLIFASQTEVILSNPLHIVLIAIPLTIQTVFIFFVAYIVSKIFGMSHDIAAPAGMIGASNFFELAVAVAITLFGTTSPAALATTVGVLTEVPVMLALVKAANNTKGWFKS